MISNSKTAGSYATRRLGDSAVVIGGSIAGLVSARVLSDYFTQVTIVERDPLPNGIEPRKGVPQGRHGHGLLGRGQQIIGSYFPDIFEGLQKQGASPVDLAYDAGWYQDGRWRLRVPTGITVSIQSRPLLEDALRRRVMALPNVSIMTECDAVSLQMNAAHTSVTGLLIQSHSGSDAPTSLAADLVVDAGGRGSRMSQWLRDAGYPKVEATQVKMNVGYTSRIFRSAPQPNADWKALIIIPTPPDKRMGLLLPIEGDRWIVSLVGWTADYAPTDDQGFLEFARSLPQPTLYNAIKDAEPLTPIVSHKIPSNLWRRYDRMARFPERLVALGDALCSFNPTYAQGMTTGTLYADALHNCLSNIARRSESNLDGLANRFRKRAAGIVANPWLLATGEDLRYAETAGARPPVLPLMHWYLNRVFEAEGHDPYVVQRFLQALHMMKSPAILFLPQVAFRVLTARWRYKTDSTKWPETSHNEVLPASR